MPRGWNFNMHATPQVQNQSTAKTSPSPTPNLKNGAENTEANEVDVAKPLVDWPEAWRLAICKKDSEEAEDWEKLWREDRTKDEMNEYEKGNNNTEKLTTDWEKVWREGMAKNCLVVDVENGAFSRPPSPTKSAFATSFIQFSDRDAQCTHPSPTKSSSMMFQRAEPTAKVVKGGWDWDWEVVDHGEAEELWEVLDGAVVEDDWDFVPEAERFRVDGLKKSVNQRMRKFFEEERVRRESEPAKVRELASKDNENLRSGEQKFIV